MNQRKRDRGSASASNYFKTLWRRLRPFVRRDLKGRLISAAIVATVIAGLSWFGLSAFTKLDSMGARDLRVELGIERPFEVCGDREWMSACTFDDRSQDEVDEAWLRDRKLRAAILQELDLRIDATLANLDRALELLERSNYDFSNGRTAAGDPELAELLRLPQLAPLRSTAGSYGEEVDPRNLLGLATYDPDLDAHAGVVAERLKAGITAQREQLLSHRATVDRQRAREPELEVSAATLDRRRTVRSFERQPARYDLLQAAKDWFAAGDAEDMSRSAFNLADRYPVEFATALASTADLWQGGWVEAEWSKHRKPAVRYASPVDDSERLHLFGIALLTIAGFVLLVVSPVVTATATAREREAGTLPVLRMTGMGAGELAVAMVVGPNVFALTVGGTFLVAALGLLSMSVGLCALLLPLALLFALATATHLTAIGLGDALGQRVNAMVVGGLLAAAIVIPGLLGTGLAGFDVASTGLLLGPLPPLMTAVGEVSGLHGFGLSTGHELARTMLSYSLAAQALLGLVCLASWRRRVEHSWAPLFRPLDGILLALVSIGCTALALFDISAQRAAEDFDSLNLLTFLSSAFLLPVLGWLLVVSLRRPARARAAADHVEVRRAFLRFQGFLAATGLLVGYTYYLLTIFADLTLADSEFMWATVGQLVLAAETGVATLLWASRRRDGKLRAAFIGGAVVLVQLVAVLGTYGLEVQHVASHSAPAWPLLLNAEASPYWMGFLILCWAAGWALIFTALIRRRDEQQAEAARQAEADEDDDDFGMPGRRLIH